MQTLHARTAVLTVIVTIVCTVSLAAATAASADTESAAQAARASDTRVQLSQPNPDNLRVRAVVTVVGWCNAVSITWGDGSGGGTGCGGGAAFYADEVRRLVFIHDYKKPGRYSITVDPAYGRTVTKPFRITKP